MDSTLLYYALAIVALGALIWFTRKQNAGSVYDAFDQFQDALDTAPQVVAAVEQLWETGAIPKDERLNAAMQRMGEWFPDLSETQLRTAIESAVWLAKQGIAMIEMPRDDGDEVPVTSGDPRWN